MGETVAMEFSGSATDLVADTSDGDESWSRRLHTLRPHFDPGHHGYYVELLKSQLTTTTPPRNVAVSGAYGSGKSSVLEGVVSELNAAGRRSVQISLATSTQDPDSLLAIAGEKSLTAALQKEIVKRLIYSAKPNDLPRSRFDRIVGYRWGPNLAMSGVTATILVTVAHALGWTLPLSDLASNWNAVPLDGVARDLSWLGGFLDWCSAAALALVALWAFSRFRVREFSVGPAKFALDDQSGNYFDQYLDEIVYFFERSKTRVAVFEDLDRFSDPGIFQALRELNNLLNGAAQIRESVSFVYAIRDSLFEIPIVQEVSAPARVARMDVQSPSAERAKFFDLVVPLVPFISQEVAADLLGSALKGLPQRLQPPRRLLILCGRYISDMRVILSIRNEYVVFASELLEKSKVRELRSSQLFAMILYKHLHLADFERIRVGESQLDAAVNAVSALTRRRVVGLESTIARLVDSGATQAGLDTRARLTGARLNQRLDIALRFTGGGGVNSYVVGADTFAPPAVETMAFWNAVTAVLDGRITVMTSRGGFALTVADITALTGERPPSHWSAAERADVQSGLEAARDELASLRSASLQERLTNAALSGPDLEGLHVDFGAEARAILGGGMAYDLLAEGFVDQNFALYTTLFHGDVVSAEARTYLMQFVDRHRFDPTFKLTATDVDDVVERSSGEVLSDVSGLNVAIWDRFLNTPDSELLAAVLATQSGATLEDFVVTYLKEGAHGEEFVELVAGRVPLLINVIVASPRFSDEERRFWLSEALANADPGRPVSLDDAAARFLAEELDQLPVLSRELSATSADALAKLLTDRELRIASLAGVSQPLLKTVGEYGTFEVTRANLELLMPIPHAIGMDDLLAESEDLAHHVASSPDAYGSALDEDPRRASVSDAAELSAAVTFVSDVDAGAIDVVLQRAPAEAMCSDLADVDPRAYAQLARFKRFPLTTGNLSLYFDHVGGVDEGLASYLASSTRLASDRDTEESEKVRVGSAIATTPDLDADTKLRLLETLELERPLELDAAALGLLDVPTVAGLLRAGVVEENVDLFNALGAGSDGVFLAAVDASTAIATLLPSLTLSDDKLALLLGKDVRDEVRHRVFASLDNLRAFVGPKAARGLLSLARYPDRLLTSEQVTFLHAQGASVASVVGYLERMSAYHTMEDVQVLVALLPPPYRALVEPGSHRAEIPFSEGWRPILRRLKESGAISDFRKSGTKFRVDRVQ